MPPPFSSIARALRRTHLSLFPLASWLARYRRSELLPDAFAGLNVALIAFPQSMIYALMAGIPVKYGLYGALLSAVATALFSGSHVLNMGPTNSVAVVLSGSFAALGISTDRYYLFGPCMLVLAGLFLVVGAFLNIASLVRYISKSVIFGYMYAVIAIMIVRQIHNALGFDLTLSDPAQHTFFDTLYATVVGLKEIDGASLAMCMLCVVFFYGWRKLFPRSPVIALTVLSLTLTGILLTNCFHIPLQTLRTVHIGDWHLSLDGFTGAHIREMSGTALILSFVALIDGTTILQTLSARMGKRCNINQMVFGMGLANILCGIGSGMPASCSLTRSAANCVSGAKTAVASLFCALFCFLGIVIFGPFLNFIPTSGLSMLIILLGFGLFEKHSLHIILKADRADACVFVWTLLSAFLFPLNVAIFLGILISVALFLKKAAVPTLREIDRKTINTTHGNDTSEISVIHATGHLFFGSAELFHDQIRTLCKRSQLKVIIIKLRRILYIDATCLLALEELLRYMRANNRTLILTEVGLQALEIFKRSGLYETVGANFIFLDDEEQTQQPTTVALECARRIVGKENATVRLPTQSPAIVHEDTLKQTAPSLQKIAFGAFGSDGCKIMFDHEQWRDLPQYLPKRRIPEEVATFIECTKSPLCIACSGGSDSLVLLLLTKLFWSKRTVIILHYNHRIRAVSDEEERQMIDLARKLDVKIEVGHRPIMPEAHHLSDAVPGTNKTPSNSPLPFPPHPSLLRSDGSLSGLPSETELRTLRYAFFEKMLRLHRSDILLLGHHADDRLETVLMRLVRGVGFEGLVAPRALHKVSFYTKVRPLLNFSKNELRDALIACNIPFFEDATNNEDDCLRNRIRHTLIPAFDKVFPMHWRDGFKRSCQLLSEQRDDLKQRLEKRFENCDFSKKIFERSKLWTLSTVEIRYFFQTWLQRHGVRNFGSQTIDILLSALHGEKTVILPLDAEHRLHLDGKNFSLITQPPKQPSHNSIVVWRSGTLFLPNGAQLLFKEEHCSIECYKKVTSGTFSHSEIAVLDAEAFALPYTVRFWENGDRYRPLGAQNEVKVKDLFSARKIPTDRRHQLPVICSANGDIAWIPGLPPADAFKMTPQTKQCVFLFYQTHKILYGGENGGEEDTQST